MNLVVSKPHGTNKSPIFTKVTVPMRLGCGCQFQVVFAGGNKKHDPVTVDLDLICTCRKPMGKEDV